MSSSSKPQRPRGKKGATKGTGGKNRRSLEGKGPTPKAEDRAWHPAGQRKAAKDRLAAAQARTGRATQQQPPRHRKPTSASDDSELVTGRNAVLEALRTRIPATTLYVAARIEVDERVREILKLATSRGIPVLEVMRPELDRLSGPDTVHQGIAIKVPPYQYAHPSDLLERARKAKQPALLVALDGVTDPRNLGAIIRSAAAFGAHGVIVPQRRSVGVTAAAWRTSAGAAARTPVAIAANLTRALEDLKAEGVFVVGLDGDGRRRPARARARRRPDRDRRRQRGQGTLAARRRDVRRDRLDPDHGGDRVAERRHRGLRDPLRGGAAPQRLTPPCPASQRGSTA
jgi:23S rRNA (guanosine2251-2'-O)-methyltransferase